MDFFKGLTVGAILTLVVCAIFASARSRGGYLSITHETIQGISFHWSWTLFIAATLLCSALFAMTPK